MFQTH
ncbi:hypothetical protein CP061683_0763A, partial [Chlamydia psittaci 06-1683]